MDPATITAILIGLTSLATAVIGALTSVRKSEHAALKDRVKTLELDKATLERERDELRRELFETREELHKTRIELALLTAQLQTRNGALAHA